MKVAFLYAGQGSQKAGMGKDLYASEPAFADVIDRADAGFDLKEIMFEADQETLSETRYTQPVLAAFAAGVTNTLFENGIRPSYTAGLSLGEYSALYGAGVFDMDTLIRLTSFRGREMQKAADAKKGVMSAILGLSPEQVDEVCREAARICREAGIDEPVQPANYNTSVQTVIGGGPRAVEEAERLAKEAGAKKCIRLQVSGAFHTAYMDPAAEALERYFRHVVFHPMRIPVIFNTTARPLERTEDEGAAVAGMLVRQVCTGVRMSQTIEYLAEKGVDTIIEIGPGRSLSGFVKKTVSGIQTYSVEDTASLRKTLNALVG